MRSLFSEPTADIVDLPHPGFSNHSKLAITRAMHACGVSEIFGAEYDDDEMEAIESFLIYLGGPYVADCALFCRLDERLGNL